MLSYSLLRGLLTKAAECLLGPRVRMMTSGGNIDTTLQMRSTEMPEVRERLRAVLPPTGPFALLLEVGVPCAGGTVLLERWEFQCSPNSSDTRDSLSDYRRAAMTLRAIATVSLSLPAVRLYRNQLQYKLSHAGSELSLWTEGATIQRFPGRLAVASEGETLNVWVGYCDPIPTPVERVNGSVLVGSRSGSPRSRPRLQSSGNLAAIAAKMTASTEAGFLPLSVSLTDDADDYSSDNSESPCGMELVIEFDGDECESSASAVFLHVCREAQDVRLFRSAQGKTLYGQMNEVQRQFAALLKTKEEIAKSH